MILGFAALFCAIELGRIENSKKIVRAIGAMYFFIFFLYGSLKVQ
jgi:hypothetical protein